MKLARAIWENLYGLLVDDGWIASGTLLAVAAVGAWKALAGTDVERRNLGGPLLFVMLMALLLGNLYVTGRGAGGRCQPD